MPMKSTNTIRICASSVPNDKLARRWALIKFCSETPLSHIVVPERIIGTHCQSLCKLGQLVNRSRGVVEVPFTSSLVPLMTTSQPKDFVQTPSLSCSTFIYDLMTDPSTRTRPWEQNYLTPIAMVSLQQHPQLSKPLCMWLREVD